MKKNRMHYEAPYLAAFLLTAEDILTESVEGETDPFEGELDPALE